MPPSPSSVIFSPAVFGGFGVDDGRTLLQDKYLDGDPATWQVLVDRHGGNGLATEYGLVQALAASRLARVAPVSREMILNFVAQNSLGLPRSY